MTQQFDNNNSGVLFPNMKKTKANQPGLRGQFTIDSKEYWASAWRKVSSETQEPYISIALQEKDVEDAPTINAEMHQDLERKSDKAPNFKGVIRMSEELELPIVSWVKQRAADGTSFFSIRIEEERNEGGNSDSIDDGDMFFGMGSAQEQAQEPDLADDFDDEIPF